MKELKEMFNEYKIAVEEANKADSEWERNPMSEELEAAFDEAYTKEFELFEELTNKIVELGNGQISKGIATTMIRTKYEEVEALIKMIA